MDDGRTIDIPKVEKPTISIVESSPTHSITNILDIVFSETVRLQMKARNSSNGLTESESKQLAMYAKIIIEMSKEEREARLQGEMSKFTDEQLDAELQKLLGVSK